MEDDKSLISSLFDGENPDIILDKPKDEESSLKKPDEEKVIDKKIEETNKKVEIESEKKAEKSPPSLEKQNENNTDSNSFPHILVFKSLAEEGVLSEFDEESFNKDLTEIGEAEAVLNVWSKHAEKIKEEYDSQLRDDFKEFVSLKDAGVKSDVASDLVTTKTYYNSIKSEDIEKEDNVELRKEIITANYKYTTNFSDAKIKKLVDSIVDQGKDVEEAKESLDEVNKIVDANIKKEKEESINRERAKEQSEKEAIKKYKEIVANTDEYIPGQKINKQTKQKIEQNILSGKIIKRIQNEPYKLLPILAYLDETGVFDGKWDKPLSVAKSKAVEELSDALRKTTKSGFANKEHEEKEDDGFDELLKREKNKR